MNDTITQRQLVLLRALYTSKQASRSNLEQILDSVSRITVVRELNTLHKKGLIEVTGKGPSTRYQLSTKAGHLKLYNPADYLAQEPDKREVSYPSFNLELLNTFNGLLSDKEKQNISEKVNQFREKQKTDTSPRELERFIIEMSWKSSKIEGNTYSLLDTEQLIKGTVEAVGHTHEEAIMILNHKKAFDYIWQNKNEYREIVQSQIGEVHWLLVEGLNINRGLRESAVGITGTVYTPPASKVELSSNLNAGLEIINNIDDPTEKGMATLVAISYLQPFADGNKRTSRLVSNAVLLAHNYPPLSYRSADEKDYKGALILFYEQGSPVYIKDLFLQQLAFSAQNYNL